MSSRAWVTLATNDSYGLGALVLAHSLRRVGSSYPAVVLITPSVTDPMRERLGGVFAEVITVDVLDSQDAAHLALLQRPELGITFTKIHCWNLTQYDKCVFLDADTLVVQNCDELFEREQLSAAPDVGWPDCFNSGVFVYSPSADTFTKLIAFAQERGSFDGGDQGLLNAFFSDWAHGDINKHLPFLYNVTSAAFYSYLPALKHYGQNLKIIHFIGAAKPWLQQFNFESGSVDAPEHIRGFLQLWWDLFVGQVHSQLDTGMVEVADTHEGPPALPPHDVGQQFHYQPTPDPESEFAWHHPDTQTKEETRKKEIDITEFHDPWTIYRGHIPPNTKEEVSQHEELARVDDHEEIRKIDDQRHDHNYYDSSDPNTQNFHAIHKVLEQHVQEKKVKKRNRRRRLHRIDVYKESILNGEVSGSETDDFDDIMPRHPYDGFYLRHRVTVDARGRKVCSHEVPPTPSPSPPPDSPVQDDSHLLEQSIPMDTNISDEQSGVAGNLARVLPGSAGQREALDELSRRQGWEAGNIDYMGADSFANIWAKISQTLSKPRTSPAKQSPPRESPPKSVPEQVVVQSGEGVQKPEAEQVEVAKEVVPAEIAPPTAVEAAPAPLLTSHWPAEPAPAPVEAAPAQVDAAPASEETGPTPVEPVPEPVTAAPASAPAEAKPEQVAASPVPVEAAVKVEASEATAETSSASVEAAPVPVEAASAPAEVVPTTVEEVAAAVEEAPASVATAPAPVEAAPIAVKSAPADPAPAAVESAEVPVTVEAVAPVEASAPVAEVPVTVEAAAPVESAAAPVVAEPSDVPVSVEAIVPDVPVPVEAVTPAEAPAEAAVQSEAPKTPEAVSVAQKTEASPVQSSPVLSASDSPPLAHTPSKEEASSPLAPAAKSEERRKPAGKLKLSPPAAADPLPTPDSELEDAAALASDIIARELLTPTVTAASPPVAQSPAVPENSRLAVEGPEVPTPPVGAVSLAQIGVKVPPKGKSTTAAQIESSITETVTPPTPDATTAPATPPIAATSPAQPSPPSDAPKKKIVKKVVKKDKEAAAGGDAPVPPPRKKEKKPKEK
ncbi:hypothetical protein HW555_001324 [Spodoptera exigua]|uniref:glycogenin glucosyltransferase n=1 Tax=Spodoptera exigua TaxID=7107 RepID=A0A835LFH6_SPOEX|nr:hypothetical protein HW555_001324 [Spodoptera exigua]